MRRQAKACRYFMLLACVACAQDFSDLKVERVVAGLTFANGLAWSRDNFLVFSDVPRDRLMKLTPGEPVAALRENANGANGNAFDAQGRMYTCESRSRRVVRTDKHGKIEVLAERWNGKRLNAPNDIAVRKEGDAYFTDPAFGYQQDTRELDFFGVFHISRKGEVDVIAKPKGRPNGVAISPNGRTLYVGNSDERNIRAYDLDRNGAASNERVLVSGIEGIPDAIRVDDNGNLYVAANGIVVYSSEGKMVNTIPMADKPASCAFGDPDLQTLYIAARRSIYRVRLNVKGSVPY
jgi:gluconolactonase